jgi:hypothetical protein
MSLGKPVPVLSRRTFLVSGSLTTSAAVLNPPWSQAAEAHPRVAAIRWFREAKFGLFVHYGMASLLPGGKLRPRPPEITDADLEKRFTRLTWRHCGKWDTASSSTDSLPAAGRSSGPPKSRTGDEYVLPTPLVPALASSGRRT